MATTLKEKAMLMQARLAETKSDMASMVENMNHQPSEEDVVALRHSVDAMKSLLNKLFDVGKALLKEIAQEKKHTSIIIANGGYHPEAMSQTLIQYVGRPLPPGYVDLIYKYGLPDDSGLGEVCVHVTETVKSFNELRFTWHPWFFSLLGQTLLQPEQVFGTNLKKNTRDKGWTVKHLLDTFPARPWTVQQFKTAGYSAAECRAAGLPWTKLHKGGYSLGDLREAGLNPMTTLQELNIPLNQCVTQFSAKEIHQSGVTWRELSQHFYLADLREEGLSSIDAVVQLKSTMEDLWKAKFTTREIAQAFGWRKTYARFGIEACRKAGLKASDAAVLLENSAELLKAGYSANELAQIRDAPEPYEMFEAGYTIQDIVDAFPQRLQLVVDDLEREGIPKSAAIAAGARQHGIQQLTKLFDLSWLPKNKTIGPLLYRLSRDCPTPRGFHRACNVTEANTLVIFRGVDFETRRLCAFGFVLHSPWTTATSTSTHPAWRVNLDFMFVLVWLGVEKPVRGLLSYPVKFTDHHLKLQGPCVGSNLVLAGNRSPDSRMRTVMVKMYEHFDLEGVMDRHMSRRVELDEMEVYRIV